MESSLHLQGAVAVSGEATLWRNTPDRNQWPQARRSVDSPFEDSFQACPHPSTESPSQMRRKTCNKML